MTKSGNKNIRNRYESPNLKLIVATNSNNIELDFVVPENMISTHFFPQTYAFLDQHHPSVLKTKCYNPNNFPFKKEVKRTEIAHLFEHLLLDLIVAEKSKRTKESTTLSGVTHWDWTKEKVGQFHIEINLGLSDHHFLDNSLPKAISFLESIFSTNLNLSPKQAD